VRPGTFALTQTLTALAALLFLAFFQQLPRVVPPLLRATHETFGGLVLAQFAASALAMLPAAVVFGFNFPAVALLIARGAKDHAAAVGRAYAANTLGAIVGATLTGFWLVPWLGSFRVVALAAAANLLLAALLEARAVPQRRWAAAVNLALVATVAAVVWSGVFYNRSLATFGAVLYWNHYEGRLTLPETAETTDILFAEDGLNASISVARTEDYIALRTNGKVDASNRDAVTQLLVGHLGAIFHPAPRRVLVIGFGSGMTVSAVALYPEVELINCVEIEPAVIRAAPHLVALNRGVLHDPRLRVILDDARNFLLTTHEKYDLIISEPSNPWIAGVATLFTEEYYRAARARLAPGGIFVQWVQAYSLYPEDLRMVLATFVPQFPQVTLWHGDDPDLLLLAFADPTPLHFERFRALWSNAALRADYQSLGFRRPAGLAAYYLLDDAGLRRLAAGSLRNIGNHTRLEYRAPRALLAKRLDEKNRLMILNHQNHQEDELPPGWPADQRPAALAAAAQLLYLQIFSRNPKYLPALEGMMLTERERKNWQQAIGWQAQRIAANPAPRANEYSRLGELLVRLGDTPSAERAFLTALQRDPYSYAAHRNLGELCRDLQRWQQARAQLELVVRYFPDTDAGTYVSLAEVYRASGDTSAAMRILRKGLRIFPGDAQLRSLTPSD